MAIKKIPTRRSEVIRRRRKDQSHASQSKKFTSRKRKRTVRMRSMPPVMTRDLRNEASYGNKRARRTRRRYDLSLNAQGVEMRLPSLPKLRPGWRLFSLSLVALMAVLLYQFWNYPAYQVEAAEVSGLKRIKEDEVNAALNVSGKPIFTIDQQDLVVTLQSEFPEFSTVAVAVEYPQTVVVTVTERVPVLIWQYAGHSTLVDESGLAFSLRTGVLSEDLPVVEAEDLPAQVHNSGQNTSTTLVQMDNILGISDPETLQEQQDQNMPLLPPAMVQAVLTLDERLPEGVVIKYDAKHGFSWHDPGEWDVYFGDEQDVQAKLVVYDAIYDYLDSIDTRPSLISVEYVHSPFYRLEP